MDRSSVRRHCVKPFNFIMSQELVGLLLPAHWESRAIRHPSSSAAVYKHLIQLSLSSFFKIKVLKFDGLVVIAYYGQGTR